MKKLTRYIDYIKDELESALDYAKLAVKAKEDGDTMLYDRAIKIAPVELEHAVLWHDLAVEEIRKEKEELKAKNIEIPPYMEYEWGKQHEYYLDKYTKAKYIIEMVKK